MSVDTSAEVDFDIADNATWNDAVQIGTPGDTTWSFTGQNFRLDIKTARSDTVALLTLSTANGMIVIDDIVQRILHFNVPDMTLAGANLIPGEYVYDLIMYDNSVPPVRVQLMRGTLEVHHGITGN